MLLYSVIGGLLYALWNCFLFLKLLFLFFNFAEQYAQAVSDFQECITILESVVEPSSRRLAETHYQMALAHGYNEAFDDAISQFQRAISIIELKITELNSFIQKSAGNEVTEEALEAARKELDDLQNLIPDIKLKVNVYELNISLMKFIIFESVLWHCITPNNSWKLNFYGVYLCMMKTNFVLQIDDAKEEKKAQGLKEIIRQSFKSDLNGDEGASNAFQNGASSSASLSAVRNWQLAYFLKLTFHVVIVNRSW